MSMLQEISLVKERKKFVISLPSENDFVIPNIRWGNRKQFFTPAFWASFYWTSESEGTLPRLIKSRSLMDEVAFCVLGGYGIKAEINLAAYHRVKSLGLLRTSDLPSASEIESALSEPFEIEGKQIRYRFPSQKSRYLAGAIKQLSEKNTISIDPLETRRWLLSFTGIGPKTASWVVRNVYSTDQVAIIDVHLHRAGILLGLFSPNDSIGKDYFDMEKRFLTFACNLGVPASKLDILIWNVMRDHPLEVRNAMTEGY